jgi:Xaa-Pro aminopeptidase
LRHEIPIGIGDPFLYLEKDGRRVVLTNSLERDRIARVAPDVELIVGEDLGLFELIAEGRTYEEIQIELVARAVQRIGLERALVPHDLPVETADRLRTDGVELVVDRDHFAQRRRCKSPRELEGIRRAQRAAEAAMSAAAGLLAAAEISGDDLVLDGGPLTAERIREALRAACAQAGAVAPADALVTTARSGGGHDPGSGTLPANAPITIDLCPRDEASGCHADMTRTFVVGTVSDDVAEAERVVRAALEAARALVRPGVTGLDLYEAAAEVIEAAGHPTQRTRSADEILTHGFYFSLGHGVGLEVHEEPSLGLTGRAPLVAGDVLALEPGVEGLPFGGVRFEDLLLITEDGSETLTDYPYDL